MKIITVRSLKALEENAFLLKIQGKRWGHIGLLTDCLMDEHLWSQLCLKIVHKTKLKSVNMPIQKMYVL